MVIAFLESHPGIEDLKWYPVNEQQHAKRVTPPYPDFPATYPAIKRLQPSRCNPLYLNRITSPRSLRLRRRR